MANHVGESLSIDVRRLILATDHSITGGRSEDENLIRDIDLSILAAPPLNYDRYSAAIRQEYSHVPDEEFAIGRGRVLRHFLDSKIYQTAEFIASEGTAKANLTRELDSLANRS